MPLRQRLASLGRNLFQRKRVDSDLDEELRAYVDQLASEKRQQGMTADEALRTARLELGGMQQVKEDVREVRTGRMLDQLLQDLRYGARTLRKNPAFTAVALLALAVGIGANTAMFSVAYGILMRPLPYADADRIAAVFEQYAPRDFQFGTMSIRDYQRWRENNRAFENPSLFRSWRMDIGGTEGIPEQVQGSSVTAGFFSTLQVSPIAGRTFVEGEDKPGNASLAVLSESIWRRRFGASSSVLGRTILVNGAPSTVIGVMPAGFEIPNRLTEVWTNLVLNPPGRFGPWLYRGIARLKPGVTLEQAQAETNNIARRLMQENPYYKRMTMPIRSLRDAMLGTTLRPALLVLTGAVGLVLLIAVVNVANLMLARATVREREMALRLSLGAGRSRLARQLLTESVLLAALGGLAGLAVAWGGINLIRVWNPGNLPLIEAVRLDGTALVFTLLVSLLTGVLFGMVPAFHSSRADLNSTLKEGGRGANTSRSRGRTRAILVVSEIALSLMLMVGAGLLLRSFVNLQRENGGFSTPPSQILTMLISPGNKKYSDAKVGLPFYDEVIRRALSVPGVEFATMTDSLPPDRQGDADTFRLEGQTLGPGEMNPVVTHATVGPDYFRALGIPLVKGREFTRRDDPNSTPVTVISEGFARRFFPHQEALGKHVGYCCDGSNTLWMEVVGIVGDVKYLGLSTDADPAYYMSFAQSYGPRSFFLVRTSGDAALIADALRKEIQSIDMGVTLAQVGTLRQAMDTSVSQPRFDTMLLLLFAGIALLLAAVGVYGLIAYSVAQRTHEIGVRMALGAAQRDVVRMVIGQGAGLAAIGIVAGLAGALALARLLATMLFGVGSSDALTFTAAAFTLLLVVLAATFVPALRATRISPVTALRYE